jgi:hypothetical protein
MYSYLERETRATVELADTIETMQKDLQPENAGVAAPPPTGPGAADVVDGSRKE